MALVVGLVLLGFGGYKVPSSSSSFPSNHTCRATSTGTKSTTLLCNGTHAFAFGRLFFFFFAQIIMD